MSKVEFGGVAKRSYKKSSIYIAIEEAIVNGIHAIEEKGNVHDGEIKVIFHRSDQKIKGLFEDKKKKTQKAAISGVTIYDNGIGFNAPNRNSFDTLYSTHKQQKGGLGFGRVSYLSFFDKISFNSVYENQEGLLYNRTWDFVPGINIFENEEDKPITEVEMKTGTRLTLQNIKPSHTNSFDKDFNVIIQKIAERLLSFSIAGYKIPKIKFVDESTNEEKTLTQVINEESKFEILHEEKTPINKNPFTFKIVKIYKTQQTNHIMLCAHQRTVIKSSISEYIKIFQESFYDSNGERFIIQCYIYSEYLDEHINSERTSFNMSPEPQKSIYDQIINMVSYSEVYNKATEIIKKSMEEEYKTRAEKRKEDIKKFFDENPHYQDLREEINEDKFSTNIKPEHLEQEVNQILWKKKSQLNKKIKKITARDHTPSEDEIDDAMSDVTKYQKTQLARYVIGRKLTIDILKKVITIDDSGKWEKEAIVHDILFPKYKSKGDINYNDHNLRILDEKLNYKEHLLSEGYLKKQNISGYDRADLLAIGHPIAMRGGEERHNPITIYEFKRPGKSSFESDKAEDPIEQVIRYANGLRNGKYKLKNGLHLKADMNTPVYGHIILGDMSPETHDRLKYTKGCKAIGDGDSYIYLLDTSSIIINITTRDRLLKNATQRNKIFFNKIGLMKK